MTRINCNIIRLPLIIIITSHLNSISHQRSIFLLTNVQARKIDPHVYPTAPTPSLILIRTCCRGSNTDHHRPWSHQPSRFSGHNLNADRHGQLTFDLLIAFTIVYKIIRTQTDRRNRLNWINRWFFFFWSNRGRNFD